MTELAHFQLLASPPRFTPWKFALIVVASALLGGLLLQGLGQGLASPTALGLLGITLGLIGSGIQCDKLTRTVILPPAVITADSLCVPSSARDSEAVSVPLAELSSLEEDDSWLFIASPGGLISLSQASFGSRQDFDRFIEILRQAIAANCADGQARLKDLDERAHQAQQMLARPTPATKILSGILLAVFALQLVSGGFEDKNNLLRWGANAPGLVWQGQWWRLGMANLIHLSYLHILLNVLTLRSLDTLLEQPLGTPRFLIAALAGGIGGNYLSAWFGHQVLSGGASAMLFALVGALLVVNFRHRKSLPAGFFLGNRNWALLLGSSLAISLLPAVDGLAHLGGLVIGIAVTWLLAKDLQQTPAARTFTSLLAAILALFYLAAALATAEHAALFDSKIDLRMALLHSPKLSPGSLNNGAWELAAATRDQDTLREIEQVMETVLASEPLNGNHLDTQAFILWRLGRRPEALALELRAAWLAPSPHKFTLLLQMLQTEHSKKAVLEGKHVQANSPGAAIYAAVVSQERRWGLLRVVLPCNQAEGQIEVSEIPADATFIVLKVDEQADLQRVEQCSADKTQVLFLPLDPEVLKLLVI